MSNILLVEDDINLGFVIQDSLKMEGHKVTLSTDGKQGLMSFADNTFDLCLLDVMLPEMDGFTLARSIRKINEHIPIVFLTAKSMLEDKIKGFELGADDYITKPFSQQEFILRIKAVLKRSKHDKTTKTPSKNLIFGQCKLNPSELSLMFEKNEIKLTKKECKVLEILAQQKNEVVERELLLKLIWGNDNYFNGRSLDVFITKLRKHLKIDPSLQIENLHGVGFKLSEIKL